MDLLKDDLKGLVLKIAIPSGVGTFFGSLLNIIDNYFAGKLGDGALGALALSFPLFFIVVSFSSGIGLGLGALISNDIGASGGTRIKKFFLNATFLGIISYVILNLLLYFVVDYVFVLLKISDEIAKLCKDYVFVIYLGSIFFIMNDVFNAILTAFGDTKSTRNVIIAANVLNFIFNPIFALGYLGNFSIFGFDIPKIDLFNGLGVAGLAITTVIFQACGNVFMFYRVMKVFKQKNITSYSKVRLQGKYLKEIIMQGIPAAIGLMVVSFGVYIVQFFLSSFENAIIAHATAMRIIQLAVLSGMGFSTALGVITGQNNGARKYDRIMSAWKISLAYSIVIIFILFLIAYMFSNQILGLFTQNPKIVAISQEFIKIQFIGFLSYVIFNQSNAIFRGFKKSYVMMILEAARQLFIPPIIFMIMLKMNLGYTGIFYGIIISNWIISIAGVIVAYHMITNEMKKKAVEEVKAENIILETEAEERAI